MNPQDKKPPVRLELKDYKIIEKILDDFIPSDLTSEELQTLGKVKKIRVNMELANINRQVSNQLQDANS